MDKNKYSVREIQEDPKNSFFAKDAKTVTSYVWTDKFIPGIKRFMYDLLINGLHMALFGSGSSGQQTNYAQPYQQVAYRQYNQIGQQVVTPQQKQSNGLYNLDKMVFESRGEAEKLLLDMSDIVGEFGFVRVSDFYDLIQKTPPVTAHQYGWRSVSDANVIPSEDGFVIRFPKCVPIQNN